MDDIVKRLRDEIHKPWGSLLLREALTFFAYADNWLPDGKCDLRSKNFVGGVHARAALAETEKG